MNERLDDDAAASRGSGSQISERTRIEWEHRASVGIDWPNGDRRINGHDTPMHAMYGRRHGDELRLPRYVHAERLVQRAIDVVVASALVVLTAPVMVAAAVAVKATSRGPVLFRQVRVGEHHRHFRILKFRTMTVGAHESLTADASAWEAFAARGFKHEHGDRHVTRVGAVLRRTSIDELPQLFNVLRGEMSLVGIRPLLPAELAARSRTSQGLYGNLRPGLTGLWQVSGRSTVSNGERVALDDRYARTWSVRQNLRILGATPRSVVRAEGSV